LLLDFRSDLREHAVSGPPCVSSESTLAGTVSIVSCIYLPNLMFEDELENSGRQLSAEPRRLVAELASVMGLLGTISEISETPHSLNHTVLVEPNSVPQGLPAALSHLRFEPLTESNLRTLRFIGDRDLTLVPWGWSQSAVAIQRQLQPSAPVPDPVSIRFVNSREFHARFDVFQSLSDANGATHPMGQLCRSLHDVVESLELFASRCYDRWVIKSNYSQAARNRLLGRGLTLDTPQKNWLTLRFAKDEPVYAEPWCERLAECGLQFWVPPKSEERLHVQFKGAAEMLTDAVGRYRGSIVSHSSQTAWWTAAVARCQAIAEHARTLGFFGPAGMDCMLFRHPLSGEPQLRFCHDINGRYTMGRVALSLQRWLGPDETGFWCHASAKTHSSGHNLFNNLDVKGVRIVPTSPSMIGSQPPDLQTALMISADCECLLQVARKILSQDIRGPFQFC
jgi:hypothetical protein